MTTKYHEKLAAWLVEPLAADVAASLVRLCERDDVARVAVMPDVHLAQNVCVGAVVATRETLLPAAVGSDIGCGMAALRVEADAGLLRDEQAAALILAELYRLVPGNRHGPATMPGELRAELASLLLSAPSLAKLADRDGRVQLGTLGRGNHFLELQADSDNALWVMVHSGSRGMGQAITRRHTLQATMRGGLAAIAAKSASGQAYLADVAWAVAYACANRKHMLCSVAMLLHRNFGIQVDWSSYLDSCHNHVRRERHGGEEYWVHRKGAQSARHGERGLLPGSMGTPSFHIVGRGCAAALHSSAHGAGRKLSRTAAARAVSARELESSLADVWFDHRRAHVLREEAPAAYKEVRAVLRAQRELAGIERELRPLLSYKGL